MYIDFKDENMLYLNMPWVEWVKKKKKREEEEEEKEKEEEEEEEEEVVLMFRQWRHN